MSPKAVKGLVGDEEKLAVVAAAGVPARAAQAWAELLARVDFIDIARSTQRLAPLIYLNLKDSPDLLERGRLRGAYKHAWSQNHRIVASLAPVVGALNQRGINYRVAKGLAVQLSLGIVGARVIGDVDLVVARDDIGVVREVLEAHGFRCNSISHCGLHSAGNAHRALDFNRGDAHIDVHVAELKEPSALMMEMLRDFPQVITYAGVDILTPSAELLSLHSAYHGIARSSETDFSQSIVDIALLARRCRGVVLRRSAIQLGLAEPLWTVSRALGDLGLRPTAMSTRRQSSLAFRMASIARRGGDIRSKIPYAWMLWRQRFRGGKPVTAALRRFQGRKLLYVLWQISGSISPIEKRVFATHRGFLPVPLSTAQSNSTFLPFGNSVPRFISANTVAVECADYRFAFRCPEGVREWVLTFESTALEDLNVAVYHNGNQVLKMVAGSSARSVALLNPPPLNEISIRPIGAFCEVCVGNLASLKATIHYRFST